MQLAGTEDVNSVVCPNIAFFAPTNVCPKVQTYVIEHCLVYPIPIYTTV